MKPFKKIFFMLIIIIGILIAQANSTEFPKLTGPYLCQTPPEMTPEIFAPGIVSTGLYTRDMAIAKGGDEIYFCVADGGWSKLIRFGPEINTPGDNANSAYVSPDGKYLFFSSSRKDPARAEFKSGTTLRAIIDSKAEPGHGASAFYWVSAKIIQEMKPKEAAAQKQ